ncbi:MAG: hypothetical protein V1816_08185 [Pseudomonadota bacterium]
MPLQKDKLVRVLALIVLCALVYYFSFDQGRASTSGKVRQLEKALAAKEQVIASLAGNLDRLKKELEVKEKAGKVFGAGAAADAAEGRFSIRLNSSRMLFGDRAAVACLAISPDGPRATLQFNDLGEGSIKSETLGVGQAVRVEFGDQAFTLILEQIYPSYVSVRILRN